jgi:hypothetical protein
VDTGEHEFRLAGFAGLDIWKVVLTRGVLDGWVCMPSYRSKAPENFLRIYIQLYDCPLSKENAMNFISRSLLATSAIGRCKMKAPVANI